MFHAQQLKSSEGARQHFPHLKGNSVVEFGSLQINGTTRGFFHDSEYTGLDVAPGPGVGLDPASVIPRRRPFLALLQVLIVNCPPVNARLGELDGRGI